MSDNSIMFLCSSICALLIGLLFRKNRMLGAINGIVFVAYSCYLYYALFYQSAYGSGLLWWVLLLAVTVAHILFSAAYLIYSFYKKK